MLIERYRKIINIFGDADTKCSARLGRCSRNHLLFIIPLRRIRDLLLQCCQQSAHSYSRRIGLFQGRGQAWKHRVPAGFLALRRGEYVLLEVFSGAGTGNLAEARCGSHKVIMLLS